MNKISLVAQNVRREGLQILETENIVYSFNRPSRGSRGVGWCSLRARSGLSSKTCSERLRRCWNRGGFGTAYKRVLDDGNIVVVKRLKDASIGGMHDGTDSH
ncbi:non-specific serine,threonine protein kinase [Sarracenia purpurea var. burkii]